MKIRNRIKRTVNRWRKSARAFYEGAVPSKHHKRNHRNRESADKANRGAVENLRSEARHLEQNYDLAATVLDVLVNNGMMVW